MAEPVYGERDHVYGVLAEIEKLMDDALHKPPWPIKECVEARRLAGETRVLMDVCMCETFEDGWRPCPTVLCERADHNH